MWMSLVAMKVWMRGRSASRTASQARRCPCCRAGEPADHGPFDLAGDRLHRFEVARGGDREAGLDHVHAQARELLRDLELLLRVERDARRLLAVAQGRVEDQYSVGFSLLGHVTPSNLDWNSSRAGVRPRPAAGVLFPPRGEEKKSQVEVQRHVESRLAAAARAASRSNRLTLARVRVPNVRYARNGEVSIAYQVLGEGPQDLVFVTGFVSHLEVLWEAPQVRRFFERLASFSRLIIWDKREQGLSDRMGHPPTLEQGMDDLATVLDAVGSERAALFGISEGGPMAVLYAASFPQRVTPPGVVRDLREAHTV